MTAGRSWGAQSWSRAGEAHITYNRQSRIHHGDVVYAGFLERGMALFIDGLVIGLAQAAAILPISLLGGVLNNALSSCRRSTYGGFAVRECDQVSGFLVFLAVLVQVAAFAIWWRFVPVVIARRGSTFGMKAMGLRMVTADGFRGVGRSQVFLRQVALAFLFLLAIGPVILWFWREGATLDDPPSIDRPTWLVVAGICMWGALVLGTYLWNVVDRRYQTLHDKVAGTVVIKG